MKNHIVTILPIGLKIEVEPGGNLMIHLVEHSIFLRSDCGGRGVCGKCRVDVHGKNDQPEAQLACTFTVEEDVSIEIPPTSLLSSHIIQKAAATLPESFVRSFENVPDATPPAYGVAVDLGTTTIALYLCDMTRGVVFSSLALKNPQALYGDDVMSRISATTQKDENVKHLQKLVVKIIEWGCEKLTEANEIEPENLDKMVVVGNPAMIHLFLGVNPGSIGIAPYQPVFFEAQCVDGCSLGFTGLQLQVHTLPQISGFIGGDILAATLAAELSAQPTGTLIVDIGTNGELVYKGQNGIYATSCATGPSFEGATISSGMQAIPGAIDKVTIPDRYSRPQCTVIKKNDSTPAPRPTGLCGSGVISVAAELYRAGIVEAGGAFVRDSSISALSEDVNNSRKYVIYTKSSSSKIDEVSISQKDIRSIQLGKAALITGIEFLLQKENERLPEKIIVAGAFGSYLMKNDMITLGMLPGIQLEKIVHGGNLAGAGAVMALCDDRYLELAKNLATQIQIVDLATSLEFQKVFVDRLAFPKHSAQCV